MRILPRALLVCALVAAHPVGSADATTRNDLDKLRARLTALTAQAQQVADDVVRASGQAAYLRVALDELADRRVDARDVLQQRVRQAYMRPEPDPLTALMLGLHTMPGLRRATLRGFATDRAVIDALAADTAEVRRLRQRAEAIRRELIAQAQPLFEAQDEARRLLADAQERYARDQAALAYLNAHRATLDQIAGTVTLVLAPEVSEKGRRQRAKEEPIVVLCERSGGFIPEGYQRSGVVITGDASWYGPGFVGNPTATGTPYDPERLTAAMLPPVPLGTVAHVTIADGRAINVLVNDRGPYVAGRVIDLSRVGAQLLGFSGVKAVRVELLLPAR